MARNCFSSVEDARFRSLNRVDILPRKGSDTAEVLHQIQDYALATEQYARIMPDDGKNLPFVNSHSVKDLRMADDFVARVRRRAGIKMGEKFKKARNGPEAGDH